MSNEVTLFDLPSRGKNQCWSHNPWKTRLALNYKGIAYKTSWIEYPDIKPTFQSFRIPPNDTSAGSRNTEFTIPAVQMPDGTYIMDSRPIADALEKLQPEPSLRLDNGYAEKAQAMVGKVLPALGPEVIPKVPKNILNPRSVEYFEPTRAKRFGMSLAEYAKCDKAGEQAWKNVEPALNELKELLAEHPEGPYVEGEQESYADLILAGMWRFIYRSDPEVFERGMKYDPSFKKHYDACSKWLERDDH